MSNVFDWLNPQWLDPQTFGISGFEGSWFDFDWAYWLRQFDSVPLAMVVLLVVSFLAATLVPLGAEAFLVAAAWHWPEHTLVFWFVASVGNIAGSLVTVAIGRWSLKKLPAEQLEALQYLERFGPPILVLAWVPLIGDVLCLLAGLKRLPWWPVALWISIGKAARFGVLVLHWL